MIIGNDRKESFIDLIKYGKQNGTYDFRNSKVIGLERDDDAEDVSGLSATKARDAARDGDIQKFINMIPDTVSLSTKRNLYRDVREGMGLGK